MPVLCFVLAATLVDSEARDAVDSPSLVSDASLDPQPGQAAMKINTAAINRVETLILPVSKIRIVVQEL